MLTGLQPDREPLVHCVSRRVLKRAIVREHKRADCNCGWGMEQNLQRDVENACGIDAETLHRGRRAMW